jgi:hypothetical protein
MNWRGSLVSLSIFGEKARSHRKSLSCLIFPIIISPNRGLGSTSRASQPVGKIPPPYGSNLGCLPRAEGGCNASRNMQQRINGDNVLISLFTLPDNGHRTHYDVEMPRRMVSPQIKPCSVGSETESPGIPVLKSIRIWKCVCLMDSPPANGKNVI